jgi:acetyl-CoA hydrolase
MSIIALPSTSGGRSNIVAKPDTVSTPRSDVDIVVTEHGIADLRGLDDPGRRKRLVQIAAPEFRQELEALGRSRG